MKRYLVLAEGYSADPHYGKTARGVMRYGADPVVAVVDSERPGEDPNKSVLDYAGMPVLVKGKVFTRGGIMAIQVASVEPYSAAKAAAK